MKKYYCKKCGGVLIPAGTRYICEDCKAVYSEKDMKALSMQVAVKPPKIVAKKEEKKVKIEVKKPFKLEKPIVSLDMEDKKPLPHLTLKSKPEEKKPSLKQVKVIRPIGAGEDPKDGISNNLKLKSKINDDNIQSSLLILAKDAMDNKEYSNAISYTNRILKLDINNRNANLIKAEAKISMDGDIDNRLKDGISYYAIALKNTSSDDYDDLAFRINLKYIEVVKEYLLSRLKGFSEALDSSYLNILKDELRHLDKFARIANKELSLNLKNHYEALARAVIDLVGKESTKAIKAFNLERMRQTDEAYLAFKGKMDSCIRIWEYTLTFSIKAETILEALNNLYMAHHAIINSCGHKLSGKSLRVSVVSTPEEKILREAHIRGYKEELLKYYLRDEDKISYTNYNLSLKALKNERRGLSKRANEFSELAEIKRLTELNKFLSENGRFKEAKENLGAINRLNRELLVNRRAISEKIEAIDRKILYLVIENEYLSLD